MITVITPTHDRPAAWPLAEKWMQRQTVQPDQWIVADDGTIPAPLTLGQQHLRSESRRGADSLAHNIISACGAAKGDIVLVMEDDDYYFPNHIEVCLKYLKHADAAGCDRMRYYNIKLRAWMDLLNTGSALCNTAFRSNCLSLLVTAARMALHRKVYHIDRFFWQGVRQRAVHKEATVVGMKGLPGTVGLGIGHRDNNRWVRDPSFKKLREWIGEDVNCYASFC